MPAAALLQLGIQLLPVVVNGTEHFIAWLHTLRTAAQQAGEWSDAQDAVFMQALKNKETAPEYQPDPAAAPSLTVVPPTTTDSPTAA